MKKEEYENLHKCYKKLWILCEYAIDKLARWSGDDDFANELRAERDAIDEEAGITEDSEGDE